MASLYEIDERLKALENNLFDIETGEIIETEDEFNKLFDEIQMDLQTKIEQTMCFYKNIMADVDAFKKEEDNLTKRRKAKENLAERLKTRIDDYITAQYTTDDGYVDKASLNKFKFETPKVKLSYRKSDNVEVDMSKLPKEYIKIETKETPMKAELKKAIKSGKKIEGAELVTKVSMQVK